MVDFDIRLGVTSFLLKAEGAHGIVDALLQGDRLDLDIWSSLVSQIKNLHLLGSGPMDSSRRVSSERYMELLDFAMRRYPTAVDLPGTMEPLVLNCVDRRNTLSVEDIQRIIQLPVSHLLPASAGEIARAAQKGAVLDTNSGLASRSPESPERWSSPGEPPRSRARCGVSWNTSRSARRVP